MALDQFKVLGPSDVLRTGGAIFLLTRKSKIAKVLGFLWLASELVSLASREKTTSPLLPAGASPGNPAKAVTGRASLSGYLGYAG